VVSVSHEARPARPGAEFVPIVLVGALLAVALAFLYAPLWQACWKEWWREESAYSHGILIPPLALLMAWHRRDELTRLVPRPALTGLVLVFLGLVLQLFARWAVSTMVSWASFLLVVTGGIAFVAGWAVTWHLLPPVLFLTFMVPMSAMLTQPFVFGAQMISTRVAMGFLRLMCFQAHQLGTIIQMENYTLQVALPCSGFKTLIALSAFAACFVYMLRGSLPKKLLLFGMATVLSLLVNGLRISLVGVTGELIGSAQATWVHDNGGLPVAALALGGLFLMARMLKCPLAPPVSQS
jgi:exosortase